MQKLVVLMTAICLGCGSAADGSDPSDPSDPNDPNDPGLGPGYGCAGEDPANDDPLVGGQVRCFDDETAPDAQPVVVIENALETYEGQQAVHIRLTFDPAFVDNTFGATSIGWEGKKNHEFKALVGSDHADVLLVDAAGERVFELRLDYISEDPNAPCGYSSLGVSGGDGEVMLGDVADVLGWSSSLDDNLNARGYCDYTVDSPATDATCTPNADAPDWDFRVVYDLWVRASAFEPAGFGAAHMNEVHASPSKGDSNTVAVTPGDCPDDWCLSPDGCDGGGGGGSCSVDEACPGGELCAEGHCVPIVL